MSVSQASLEQVRGILASPEINREQLDALKRNANLCGSDPEPSGFRDGEPFWKSQNIIEWSETAKRSRTGSLGMSQRSMLDTLLGREQERESKQMKSVADLAVAVAFEQIDAAEAEAQCLALGVTAADLESDVCKIHRRQALVDDCEKALGAKEDAERLRTEIQLIDEEIEAFVAPKREQIMRMETEATAAERQSTTFDRISQQLRQSAPQYLLDAIANTRHQLNEGRARPDYLRRKIDQLALNVDSTENEIDQIGYELSALTVRKSDYEGKQKKDALKSHKEQLGKNLKDLRSAKRGHEKELKSLASKSEPLQNRLLRLEELSIEVWPQPSDLDQ